jgi:GYF domain 2
MRWYVERNGTSEGPLDAAAIVKAIGLRQVDRKTPICAEGKEDWVELGSVAMFASAFRASAHPPATRKQRVSSRMIWLTVATVSGVLLLGGVTALIWLVMKLRADEGFFHLTQVTRLDTEIAELKKLNAPGTWTPEAQVQNNCYTDRMNVTCTFTNLSEIAVTTCNRGVLARKLAPGVKLESVIMCTGKLSPAETKTIVGPWIGGFADDICFKQNDFGKTMDWSKCNFTTEPVDLPTMRKMEAAR